MGDARCLGASPSLLTASPVQADRAQQHRSLLPALLPRDDRQGRETLGTRDLSHQVLPQTGVSLSEVWPKQNQEGTK